MSALYRAQVLLEAKQHRALQEMARRDGRSVSDLVRESVQLYLDGRRQEALWQQRAAALQALGEIRAQIEARHGLLEEGLLADTRAEREQEIDDALRGEP